MRGCSTCGGGYATAQQNGGACGTITVTDDGGNGEPSPSPGDGPDARVLLGLAGVAGAAYYFTR